MLFCETVILWLVSARLSDNCIWFREDAGRKARSWKMVAAEGNIKNLHAPQMPRIGNLVWRAYSMKEGGRYPYGYPSVHDLSVVLRRTEADLHHRLRRTRSRRRSSHSKGMLLLPWYREGSQGCLRHLPCSDVSLRHELALIHVSARYDSDDRFII